MNIFLIAFGILLLLSGIFVSTYLFTDETDELTPMAMERRQTEGVRTGEIPVSVSAPTPTPTPNSEEVTDLSSSGLTVVPVHVFQNSIITELNLSGNKLSGALPAEVRNLSALKILNLENNNFTGIPAEVGQLSSLEVLDVSGNPVTGLPIEIGNLSNLKVFDLRDTDYSVDDLSAIKRRLPASVVIRVD